MRRILVAVVSGSLWLATAHPAWAFDYTAPMVPPGLRDAPAAATESAPQESTTLPVTGPAATEPTEAPDMEVPPEPPRSASTDGESGGCALWDWATC
ncbi:MAG TPA: hypothetical protein VNM50_04590 [Chloroflexota bacterium]|nr:hypothetical protein [Chloroflexota bacterium]